MAIKQKIEKIIPKFILNSYHYKLALLSAIFYGFPSRKLIVIGVTGTKGKSSTVILAGKILEETGAKVAWLTSATIKVAGKEILNPYHMTMPGRFAVQKFLRQAAAARCKYAILEVTSEGVKQYRHKFINFNTAVFTNLQPEHLEAHGSFENYRYCKGLLFKATKQNHVLNIDDKNIDYFLQFPAERKMGYSTKISNFQFPISNKFPISNFQMIKADNVQESREGIKFSVNKEDFNSKLLGKFNVYNCLAAMGVALGQGLDMKVCKKALEKIDVIAGRMEVVQESPFKVIVDLAHTPDSYEEVFKAVKAMPHGKIITVFGSAGGGRDKWKRPVLGKIAAENSDYIILTNEDPYDENPESILNEIESGFPQKPKYEKILDRRQAIKKALFLAEDNDIVLVLGKGTEQLMFLPAGKIHWDDRDVVREELTGK